MDKIEGKIALSVQENIEIDPIIEIEKYLIKILIQIQKISRLRQM